MSAWSHVYSVDHGQEITTQSSKVELHSSTSHSVITIDKEVVAFFFDIIKHNFGILTDIEAVPDSIYFNSLSLDELIHVGNLLIFLHSASQDSCNQQQIHQKLTHLCKHITNDQFFRKIMSTIRDHYNNDQRIITNGFMRELIDLHPRPSQCFAMSSSIATFVIIELILQGLAYLLRQDSQALYPHYPSFINKHIKYFQFRYMVEEMASHPEIILIADVVAVCAMYCLTASDIYITEKYWRDFARSLKDDSKDV